MVTKSCKWQDLKEKEENWGMLQFDKTKTKKYIFYSYQYNFVLSVEFE